ncbi:precorrin-3B synthase [Actinokineospora globicatena]|nr:precorrin-3B synthase [Actinokineospora globicatena]GLW85609.1 precorrin-3B synthase [Actinokineospora globicatena]
MSEVDKSRIMRPFLGSAPRVVGGDGRSVLAPGSRLDLAFRRAPWRVQALLPGDSGGTAPDSHRLPPHAIAASDSPYIRLVPPSQRRTGADACPGALDVHRAADGGLARVRVPGGRLRAEQLHRLADLAVDLGDGALELTSRANLQLRGLAEGAELDLGAELAAIGLLPSRTHEKVRNIMASPLGPGDLVAELDTAVCAESELAALPGRFLFALDSGAGDVAWSRADLAALPVGDRAALLIGGVDHGIRLAVDQVVPAMVACAKAFLRVRDEQWRIAELPDTSVIVAALVDQEAQGQPFEARIPVTVSPTERVTPGTPPTGGPIGPVVFADGGLGVGAAVPLGRLTAEQARALGDVVITPWRGVVVRGDLPELGLITDPSAPGIGVTSCAGRPHCHKALADVRAAALAVSVPGRAVHWAGCGRRCGRPAGDVLDVVATTDGYLVDGRAIPGERVAEAVAQGRQD